MTVCANVIKDDIIMKAKMKKSKKNIDGYHVAINPPTFSPSTIIVDTFPWTTCNIAAIDGSFQKGQIWEGVQINVKYTTVHSVTCVKCLFLFVKFGDSHRVEGWKGWGGTSK